MMRSTILLASLALIALPACSGGGGEGSGVDGGGGGGGGTSGIPGTTQINNLTPEQVDTFCTWGIGVQGGESIETDCGDGATATSGTVVECVADFSEFPICDLTVAQVESCILEIGEDPCGALGSAECADFVACIFSE